MLAEAEQHISQIKMEELLEAVQKILLKKNQQIKLKRKIKKEMALFSTSAGGIYNDDF